jgi:hypothetical protein
MPGLSFPAMRRPLRPTHTAVAAHRGCRESGRRSAVGGSHLDELQPHTPLVAEVKHVCERLPDLQPESVDLDLSATEPGVLAEAWQAIS